MPFESVYSSRLLLPLLVVSVAGNVMQGFTASSSQRIRSQVDGVREPGSAFRIDADVGATTAGAGRPDARRYARLEQAAFSEARQIAAEYWKSGFEQDYGGAMFAARESLRATLIDATGADVVDDPVLGFLFRPMDPLYDFLSPAEQVAVQELRFERDTGLQKFAREAGASAQPGSGVDAQQIHARYREGLRELLGDDGLFELELRESPVAGRIRRSGMVLSEAEFREVFSLLASLNSGRSGPAAALDVRHQLLSVLGSERFSRLWSSGDPFYPQLRQLVAQAGLADSDADAVYAVFSDHEGRRLQSAVVAGLDPGRASVELSNIAAAERGELERLVGTELAGEILRARAMGSYTRAGSRGEAAGW